MEHSSNAFQGSDFAQSEDIVIIVENSSLFQDMDISPDRLTRFLDLLKVFIDERLKIDYRDRYLLITFDSEVKVAMEDFDSFSQILINQIQANLDSFKAIGPDSPEQWQNNALKALQTGIQKCIASFKKIRNKTLRIILFTNQLPSPTPEFNSKFQQIIERTAQRLDIVLDALLIAGNKPIRVFDYENPLRSVCSMTGGEYFSITSPFEFEEAFRKITKKKEVLRKSYLGERIYAQEKQFLEIIASDLQKVTEILDESLLKCNICFKVDCTCGTLDKYEHIRMCPNCSKVLHSCCAGRWAEQQNTKSNFIGFPNVFRCPYCFFLLKVDRNFVNFDMILNQLQEKWLKMKEKEDLERMQEEQKEKEITAFIDQAQEKKSEEQCIIEWLTARLPSKSRMDIKRLCQDIMVIEDKDEREDFVNYLKFKEGIDDDTLPF